MEILDKTWQISPQEKKERDKYWFRAVKTFDFPDAAISDLINACKNFGRDPEKVPDYVLRAFGFEKEKYPDEQERQDAFYDFAYEYTDFIKLVEYNQLKKVAPGKVYLGHENMNLPLFARIAATVLKEYKADNVLVIEASRLDDEWFTEDVMGGEVWAIGPGMVERGDTTQLGKVLAAILKGELEVSKLKGKHELCPKRGMKP